MGLADELIPYLQARGVGILNAGPFSARLLTNAPLPKWLKEPEPVKAAARKAAQHCLRHGVDLAKLALQFSLANPDITTKIEAAIRQNSGLIAEQILAGTPERDADGEEEAAAEE